MFTRKERTVTKKGINMAGRKKTEENSVGLEESLAQLEQVMETMETSELSLEQSFDLYKKGMDLLLQCNQAIDKVEKELMILEGMNDGI